jgi:hypothetical protein
MLLKGVQVLKGKTRSKFETYKKRYSIFFSFLSFHRNFVLFRFRFTGISFRSVSFHDLVNFFRSVSFCFRIFSGFSFSFRFTNTAKKLNKFKKILQIFNFYSLIKEQYKQKQKFGLVLLNVKSLNFQQL